MMDKVVQLAGPSDTIAIRQQAFLWSVERDTGDERMKTFIGLLFMITMTLTLGCGSNSGDESRFNGTWKYTQIVTNGKETPAELISRAPTVTFEGNKMIRKEEGKVAQTWTYKTDATQDPKQMTITMGEPGKEKEYYHIYRIAGDTLTMCSSNKRFSKEFNTKLEPGANFSVLTRVKD
jgi:uncharacterized protein (TIGR03067 family)